MSSSISLQGSNKKAIIDVINGCLKVIDATHVWNENPENIRKYWKEVRKIELSNFEEKSKKQLLYIAKTLKASMLHQLKSIDRLGAIGSYVIITTNHKFDPEDGFVPHHMM